MSHFGTNSVISDDAHHRHETASSIADVIDDTDFDEHNHHHHHQHQRSQYRVTTKGRKTFIQKVHQEQEPHHHHHQAPSNSSSVSNDVESNNNNDNAIPPPSASARQKNDDEQGDLDQKNEKDIVSLLGDSHKNDHVHETMDHSFNAKSSTTSHVVVHEQIHPRNGHVLEVTHSIDEPIHHLSFFKTHESHFLPRPEHAVVAHHHRHQSRIHDNYEDTDSDSVDDHHDDNERDECHDENDDTRTNQNTGIPADDSSVEFENNNNILSINNENHDHHHHHHHHHHHRRKSSVVSHDVNGNNSFGSVVSSTKSARKPQKQPQQSQSSTPKPTPTVTIREIFSGSKNVPRMFIYNLLDGACFGLWQAAVLPNFMYIIGGDSNAFVGYNAAAQGGCQMTSALIAAYVGDKKIWPKRYLLRLASLVGCVAIAVTVMAVNTRSAFYFWPSSALWGVYMGFSNPASESIFADSVPGGQRVAVYTYKWILQLLSYLVGYITTIIMFSKFGDSWELNEMTPVLYAGLFAHITSMISLWFLHDDFTLDVHKVKSDEKEEEKPNSAVTSGPCVNCGKMKGNAMTAKITSFRIIAKKMKSSASTNNNDNDEDNINNVDENNINNNAASKTTTKCSCVISEKDKLFIEELEDDAKREKTGDPLLSDICPACCCCCASLSSCCNDDDDTEQKEQNANVDNKKKNEHRRLVIPIYSATSSSGSQTTNKKDNNHDANNNYSSKSKNSYQAIGSDIGTDDSQTSKKSVVASSNLCEKMSLVPLLIVMGDVLQAVGGGVTVQFFPLFFKNDLHVTPVQMASVSIILCVVAAGLSKLLQHISSNFKRTSLIVVIRLLGSGLMFLLEFAEGAIGTKYPMLAYFVLRSALLNSMMGLSRSIIMDFCRKRHRTFFSAMESVSMLSFSGSAAIGGVVADAHGYRSTFAVTAGFYIASALTVLPGGWWVDTILTKGDENSSSKKEEKK